jgi:hypothetical protein
MSRLATLRWAGIIAGLSILIFFASCNNIWEWTADSDSFDVIMAEGREAMQGGDYARAEELFGRAVELRPTDSEARYYYAKAAVLNADVDVFTLVQTLTDEDSEEGPAATVFSYEIPVANSIYRVNRIVLDNLEPIRQGAATTGAFVGVDVDLDLAVAYLLRGILRLRDTNGDGVIDENDVAVDDFLLNGEDGNYSLDGIGNVPPEDLNDMINDLNDLLGDGGGLLGDLLGDSGIDVEDLNNLIDSLGGDLSAYYVNTGVPGNPGEGDNDGDGRVDEECLNDLDDDGDGIVDEDSRLAGCS